MINCLFIYILRSYCYVIGVTVCLSHVFVCLFTIFAEFRSGTVSVYLCSLFISFQVCLFVYLLPRLFAFSCLLISIFLK